MRARFIALLGFCFVWLGAQGAEPLVIPLWSGGAPGFEDRVAEPEKVRDRTEPAPYNTFQVTTNIHNPSLLAFPASRAQANGTAIIVAPGGGHMFLTMGREGVDVAKWFQARGISAFVLKYRLARADNSPYTLDHCVEDGRRAIRLVRSRATEWGIDPSRVGILGFSAGGHVALIPALEPDDAGGTAADAIDRLSARPDFMVSIYGSVPREDFTVPASAPPAFLLKASDDRPESIVELYSKYREAGASVELHLYSHGGHGFGMQDRPFAITAWPQRVHDWLGDQGLLRNSAPGK